MPICYSPSSLSYEVQHLLYTFYMLTPSLSLLVHDCLSVSLAIHRYLNALSLTSHSTMYFLKLFYNHDHYYFHASKLPSKERYTILCLLNILVHLDITLPMFNWQLQFNVMKAVPDFLTWMPYLLHFPGRSSLF